MSLTEETAKEMEKLRADRQESDIPLSDKYWDAANRHKQAAAKAESEKK